MKHILIAGAAFLALGLISGPTLAKDLPAKGMTAEQVASWLQDDGYKAQVSTNKDGSKTVGTAADGSNFFIDMYDCNNTPTCTAIQFSIGFDSKGAWNATKMNEWNSTKRWVKAYVDDKDDPWLQMDIDLSPGGTQEGLDDQFAIWRDMLTSFKKYINW